MSRTPAKQLYLELDTFVAGLGEFMQEMRAEAYKSNDDEEFDIAVCPHNRLLFGFYTKVTGARCPDPVFVVEVDDQNREINTETIEFRPLMGSPARLKSSEDVNYTIKFMHEVNRRKKDGEMMLSHRVQYRPDYSEHHTSGI